MELNSRNVMRVVDMARRPGVTVESRDDRLSMEAPLFRGAFWHRELRRGLHVHASDVFEEADFTANSSQLPGLSCVFFLSGEVQVEIGGRVFQFRGCDELREGFIISSARAESFRRLSRGHQKIRHLVVSATPEWLDRDGLASVDDHRLAQALLQDHLASQSWRVTSRLTGLVRQILASSGKQSTLQDLLVESAAVEIIAEALAASTHQDNAPATRMLSSAEQARLKRAEHFINARSTGRLHVEEIAREAGVSASGLQRLFKAAYGASVLDRVRQARLDEARALLVRGESSIQEAAQRAGYTSAANFATAFKRQFGMSPGEASRGV